MPRVTITVPDKKSQPYRFALDRKSVSLGRGSENDIVIDCGSVSVRHAVMERGKGGYRLRDLGSTNGTKIDGKAKDSIDLFSDAPVKLGDVRFDFTLTDEEEATLRKERPSDDSPITREKEEDREAPRRKPAPVRKPVVVSQPSGGASFVMTLLFLILAAGSFFVGMSLRHSKETGNPLTQSMKHGLPEKPDPGEVDLPEINGDLPE